MDATLVRILTVVLTLFTGVPVVLYLVALFLMPEEDVAPSRRGPARRPGLGRRRTAVAANPAAQPTTPAWTEPAATPGPPVPADPPRREDHGV